MWAGTSSFDDIEVHIIQITDPGVDLPERESMVGHEPDDASHVVGVVPLHLDLLTGPGNLEVMAGKDLPEAGRIPEGSDRDPHPVLPQKIIKRVLHHKLPSVEHNYPVTDGIHILKEVGGKNVVGVPVFGHGLQGHEHLVTGDWIESRGGFVHEDDVGIVDDGLGQLDLLFHAPGVASEGTVPLVPHVQVVEHLMGTFHGLDLPHARETPHGGDEFHGIQIRGKAIMFRHVADMRPDIRTLLEHIESQHPACASVRRYEPKDDLDQGGFSRAVGSEQGDPSSGDGKGDVMKRQNIPETFRYMAELYQRS